MKILDGKKIANEILEDLKNKIVDENIKPNLAVVLVGNDEASRIYVNLKGKAAEKIGVGFQKIELDENVSQEEVLKVVAGLNADENIHGIIVQLPLPNQLDKIAIIQAIDPKKDVDGFHDENIEKFFAGQERFFPVFPLAIMELLKSSGENLENKSASIICNSQEFGKTMQAALKREKISAQYFFSDDVQDGMVDLKDSDIVISACGKPDLLSGEMLKEGAIIVDGGITRVGDKVVGDVNLSSVQSMEGFISPVPGGVGPVTIACLLRNVYLASRKV